MSRKRGTQHLKKHIPSERPSPQQRLARAVAAAPVQQVSFYDHALTVENDSDGILGRVAEPVEKIDDRIKGLCARMVYLTVTDPNCLGIAAPQMGESVRVITVKSRLDNGDVRVEEWINPACTPTPSSVRVAQREGCYSLPTDWGVVERDSAVRVTGIGIDGKAKEAVYTGLAARAVQHEIDHLDGVLISAHAELEPVPEEFFTGTPEQVQASLADKLGEG